MNQKIRTIYRYILSEILEGRLRAGDVIPSEVALAANFDTTRMNAGRALAKLKGNHILISHKRAGTRIISPLPDREKLVRLQNALSRQIYVLYSSTPHNTHWSKESFDALEKVVGEAGYEVCYKHIPTGSDRQKFSRIISQASHNEAAALLIFPDSEDSFFLNDNSELLLGIPTPVYVLNRGNNMSRLDFVSSIILDCYADGILMAQILQKNNFTNFVILGNKKSPDLWHQRRLEGLQLGFASKDDSPVSLRVLSVTAEDIDRCRDLLKPDTIFISLNNFYAAQFIDGMEQRHHLCAGRDYEVVSFDDNPIYRSYNLTGMVVPLQEVGEVLGHLACTNAWYRNYPVHIAVRITSQWVQRSSCRPLKI